MENDNRVFFYFFLLCWNFPHDLLLWFLFVLQPPAPVLKPSDATAAEGESNEVKNLAGQVIETRF